MSLSFKVKTIFINMICLSSSIALGDDMDSKKESSKFSKFGIVITGGENKLSGDEFESKSQNTNSLRFYIEEKLNPSSYGDTGKSILSAFGGISSRIDLDYEDMKAIASSKSLVFERGSKANILTSSLSPMICVLSDTNFRACPFLSIMSVAVRQKNVSKQDYSTTGYGFDMSYRFPIMKDEKALVSGLNLKTFEVKQTIQSQSTKFASSRMAIYLGMEF